MLGQLSDFLGLVWSILILQNFHTICLDCPRRCSRRGKFWDCGLERSSSALGADCAWLGWPEGCFGALGAVVFWALGGALEWSAWGCGKSSGLCVVV